MRALGPGSVSSFLKVILDVVYAGLWVLLGLVAVGTIIALLFSFDPGLISQSWRGDATLAARWPLYAGGLVAAGVLFAGILVIVDALRRIFVTLTAGDPFHPQNVRRLRLIGVMLAALEIESYVVWGVGPLLPSVLHVKPNFDVTAWFSVLVVFVLAEVFREGARLRREAELTI